MGIMLGLMTNLHRVQRARQRRAALALQRAASEGLRYATTAGEIAEALEGAA